MLADKLSNFNFNTDFYAKTLTAKKHVTNIISIKYLIFFIFSVTFNFPFFVLVCVVEFGVNFYTLFFLAPDMVFDAFDARAPRAIGAAEEIFLCFDAVPDDAASAICANGRELMNRAFETIENVPLARRYYFKRQIIIISANLALCHFPFLLALNV